jgi:hypothetical protein
MEALERYLARYAEFYKRREGAKGYDFGQALTGSIPPARVKFARPLRWWSWDRPGRIEVLLRFRDEWQQEILRLDGSQR